MSKNECNLIAEALCSIACEIKHFREQNEREFEWHRSHSDLATKNDLDRMENKIMEQIQTFGARTKEAFTKIGASVDGVVADVQMLKDKIDRLNESPGQLSSEDTSLLAEITTIADQVVTKLEALDSATGPGELPVPA